MGTVLTGEKLYNSVASILTYQSEFLYVISPFVRWDFTLIDLTTETKIVTRYDSWHENQKPLIRNGFKIYDNPKLHSKIYLNDNYAIVSSMNLYETTIVENHETGVEFFKSKSPNEYSKLLNICKSIVNDSLLITTK